MSNSYRIRTQVGVDTSLKVMIDQEFEYLEILSLKILQSDIYTRQCADYGVVVGRVSVNNGFGLPNAKVSIFIPLDAVDKEDPVTSNIYPYTNLYDVNDDGYRYNLLPYKPSYSAHVPTGTFFTRRDVLLSPVLGDIYDKYYKYNAVTNSSGDYMIFGVPVGSHTIVVDIDLSDIGEFSLSPQDLIRMGVATENQVDGTKFRSSTNLGELPQIVSIKRTIEIEPLWGQPEICNLGITRTDFDLTGEANIDIRPTAIFMGSMISDSDSNAIKSSSGGKPTRSSGFLCNVTTGPGEILAIRQTIQEDSIGRPILESYGLEGGGTIIDENGTWMVDVPMNLDYYITNEFGEQVLSPDPEKGIPTKGKYRFKIKWAQSPSASASTKRANYLVPNIKDWVDTDSQLQQKSYAFSLDWDDYGDDTSYPEMIQEAIDCKDRFYMMQYNKVYTVSQFIDEYRRGSYQRFTGIKNILDDVCESGNNRYPTNDGYFRFDFFYVLFSFLSIILTPIFYAIILLLHIVYFIVWVLRLFFLFLSIYYFIVSIQHFAASIGVGFGVVTIPGNLLLGATYLLFAALCVYILLQLMKINLSGIAVPILTYPDCNMCDCKQGDAVSENPDEDNGDKDLSSGNEDIVPCPTISRDELSKSALSISNPILLVSTLSPWKMPKTGTTVYNGTPYSYPLGSARRLALTYEFTGRYFDGETGNPGYGVPYPAVEQGLPSYTWITTGLPIADRINLFNVKAKYFDGGPNNPGGSVNRVRVTYQPQSNPGKKHYDNTIVILCDKATLKKYVSGQMIAFQNPSYSKDPNINSPILNYAGNYAITGTTGLVPPLTGTTSTGAITVPVSYASFDGNSTVSGPNSTYNITLTGNTKYSEIYRFPTDVEYFQVITGMTYSAFTSMCSTTPIAGSLNERYIRNVTTFYNTKYNNDLDNGTTDRAPYYLRPIDSIKNSASIGVVILNRGVDPYTDKINIEYGLGKLFGFSNEDAVTFTAMTRMNIPIQKGFKNISHLKTDYPSITINGVPTRDALGADAYTGNKLYYDSYLFTPQANDVSGNTITYNEDMTTGLTWTFLSAGYSGFESNLISYYSSLDTRSGSFTPGCVNVGATSNPRVNSFGVANVTNSLGISVSPNNLFTRTFNFGGNSYLTGGCGGCGTNGILYRLLFNGTQYDLINNNQGYIPNEIVEGNSIMAMFGYFEAASHNCDRGRNCGWRRWRNISANPVANATDTIQSYYYSPTYNTTGNTLNFSTGSSGKVKIMRGDRLPTSTVPLEFCCNSWVLQKNYNFQAYLIPDKGVVGITSTVGSTGSQGSGVNLDTSEDLKNQKNINGLFETFTCNGSANLECYGKDCLPRNGVNNAIIKIGRGSCSRFLGKTIFSKGCYKLITTVFLSLLNDWALMSEWIARNMVMLGACRNVFSHTFSNNWVNGNLYVMSFKNDAIGFTSPTSPTPNSPIYRYPTEVVIRHTSSKNFYYRCAGYDADNKQFVTSIKYPTTIIDLGPRSIFLQEIVMSDEYDGYIVNKLDSSSFSQVDEILNLFIISRFLNNDFIENILGLNIMQYFNTRTNLKFDADYSQLLSISSELGVAAFQSTNYPDEPAPKQSPIYIGCDGLIGIFFSSDTQTRDFLTPKRTIIDPTGLVSNQGCSLSNFPIYSQEVPLSQWKIENGSSIFGTDGNEWFAEGDAGYIYSSKYQSLDRLEANSRYFRNYGITIVDDKGLIYAVDGAGDLIAATSAWSQNTQTVDKQLVTVGAPFHFYFGLKRGASSFDRFKGKWINTEIIVD
jgi:hypothetical protein